MIESKGHLRKSVWLIPDEGKKPEYQEEPIKTEKLEGHNEKNKMEVL